MKEWRRAHELAHTRKRARLGVTEHVPARERACARVRESAERTSELRGGGGEGGVEGERASER